MADIRDERDDIIADIEVNSKYTKGGMIPDISYNVGGKGKADIGDRRYERYSRYRREPDIFEKERCG